MKKPHAKGGEPRNAARARKAQSMGTALAGEGGNTLGGKCLNQLFGGGAGGV
ncbi:MAG: hypothetical protein RRY54_02555 [Angelakisella sp.]